MTHVQIPVNTKATVYVPAKASSKIYMNGKITRDYEIQVKDSVAVIQTGSGEYKFEVKE